MRGEDMRQDQVAEIVQQAAQVAQAGLGRSSRGMARVRPSITAAV